MGSNNSGSSGIPMGFGGMFNTPYYANLAARNAAKTAAPPPPVLPALAPPPPAPAAKDPLIGREQNLGTAKIASTDLKNGAKTLLGG